MITGEVVIDLSSEGDPERSDRRRLAVLEHCPEGSRVVVNIGDRLFVTQDAARWLHQHDHRLTIVICGSRPHAVAQFIRAARAGEWSVAG